MNKDYKIPNYCLSEKCFNTSKNIKDKLYKNIERVWVEYLNRKKTYTKQLCNKFSEGFNN